MSTGSGGITLPTRVVDYCIVVGAVASRRSSVSTPPAQPDNAAIAAAAAAQPTASSGSSSSSNAAPAVSASPSPVPSKQLQPGEVAPHKSHRPHPVILQRFPFHDWADAECPKDITMFAFPSLSFELSSRQGQRELFACVLTEANGSRVYVSCMRWWERADEQLVKAVTSSRDRRSTAGKMLPQPDDSTANGALASAPTTTTTTTSSSSPVLYAPKCLVLTSHWPYFTQMESYLTAMYAFIIPSSASMPFPIERSLQNLIEETPLPPPGQLQVECRPLLSVVLLFSRPPPNALPLRDFSTLYLFHLLSADNVLLLLAAVCTEKRVLFFSSILHRLTLSAEALLSLLFPFYWRQIYIPLLPQQLLEFTCAPMPFIMGCPAAYRPSNDLLDGVCLVDLDSNSVTWNGSAEERPAGLPPTRLAVMQKALRRLLGDTSAPIKPGFSVDESELHAVFLRFFARLLSHYRDCLLPLGELSGDRFDRAAFLDRSEDKTAPFLLELLDTQMFQSFIDDRYDDSAGGSRHLLQPPQPAQPASAAAASSAPQADQTALDVLIFDEWIDRELGRPTPFLSDSSHDHRSDRRFQVPLPYSDDLDTNVFHYTTFPTLSPSLLCVPPRLPPLLSQPPVSQHATPASLSMKFFTEKRLYSQYFHTLRLRSSRHDLVLKDVTSWGRESARLEEERCLRMAEMCRQTVEKESIETESSVDTAWYTLRRFVTEQAAMEQEMFAASREAVFIPLATAAAACEHQLRLLFSEATVLEAKAAKLKSSFERSKAKAKALEHRYLQAKQTTIPSLQQQQQQTSAASAAASPAHSSASSFIPSLNGLGSSSSAPSSPYLLSPAALSSLVTLRSESEDALLQQDEEEEAFTSIVAEYEDRMPEIVDGIRQLNRERLSAFKLAMTAWCQGRRQWLDGMMSNLELLEGGVLAMDVDRDMRQMTEGAAEFRLSNLATQQKDHHQQANGAAAAPSPRPTAEKPTALSPSQKPALTITTTSPASRARKASAAAAGSTSASSSPTHRRTDSLGPSIDVVSPTSAPNGSQAARRFDGRVRSLSSASSASQPTTPVQAAPPSPQPATSGGIHTRVRAPSLLSLANFRSGSSPRLNVGLPSSHSSSSLSSSHSPRPGSSPAPAVPSHSLSATFLQQLRKQHSVEDARDQQRAERARKETEQWRTVAQQSVNELTPSYPLQLWGDAGFELACQQGTSNKRTMKELTIELEQWAQTMETKRKRLDQGLLMLPRSLTLGSGQARAWDSCRQRVSSQCRAYADFLSAVYRAITELKLEKGELKAAVRRYGEHKLKLERELQQAAEAVSRAQGKRQRASFSLAAVEAQQRGLDSAQPLPQKALELNAQQVEKAIRDFKEADHEWTVSERDRQAEQRKHDGCVARMLLALERRDQQAGLTMKRLLASLAAAYDLHVVASARKGDEAMLQAVRGVDVNRELLDFITASHDSSTPQSAKPQPGEPADLSRHLRHLGPQAWPTADGLLVRAIDSLRVQAELMQQLAETEEADARSLQKAVLPVKSCTNASLQLALTALDVWLERQAEEEEAHARLLRDSVQSFNNQRASMKTQQKALERRVQDMEKAWRKAQDERDRAALDERRSEEQAQQAKQKLDKAQREAEGGAAASSLSSSAAAAGGRLFPFYSHSVDSLRHRLQAAEADLSRARAFTAGKEKAFQEETARRDRELAAVLLEAQRMEQSRWQAVVASYSQYVERHRQVVERVQQHVSAFRVSVRRADLHADLLDFLAKNNSGVAPPLVVLEAELKRKEEAEREEREKEEDKKRREMEEERSRTGRSRRSRAGPSSPSQKAGAGAAGSTGPQPRMAEVEEGREDHRQSGAQHSPSELAAARRPLPSAPADGAVTAAPAAAAAGTSPPLSSTASPAPLSAAPGAPAAVTPPFPPPRPPRPTITHRILSPKSAAAIAEAQSLSNTIDQTAGSAEQTATSSSSSSSSSSTVSAPASAPVVSPPVAATATPPVPVVTVTPPTPPPHPLHAHSLLNMMAEQGKGAEQQQQQPQQAAPAAAADTQDSVSHSVLP